MTEESVGELETIISDGEIAKSVYEASLASMGQDLTEIDAV